ncbi:pickpocket protein 28-like isoform X2 [Macrosteles quadrilineatus]|nr:pickpocket protein 28-like isoform X2 [Macrosteles quadrilineatus]
MSVVVRRARRMDGRVPDAWPDPELRRRSADSTTDPPSCGCSCHCLRHAVADFTQHSSLHGLRYVADPNISRAERLFWIVSFALACIFATNFISNVYYKWTHSPVILSLSPEPTPLSAIPFPAITICNMNNAKKSVALDIQRRAQYAGVEGSKDRKMLNDFCGKNQEGYDFNVDESEISWKDLRSFMVNVSQPCHEMLVLCLWHSETFKCEDLFNPTLTDEGICCTFNRVKRDYVFQNPRDLSDLNVTFPFESIDWTPEKGFPPNAPVDWLPWRAWGAGNHLGLSIVLNADLDEYYCSSEVSIGFKIVLHNSVETPKMNAFASLLSPGLEARMIVDPVMMTTTQLFHTIPAKKRNCVFGSEKNLTFYRTYTQRNCALECEAQFTLDACSCVLYYMPKNDTTRICGRKDEECAKKALKAMELRLVDDGNVSSSLNTTKTKSCGCKPGCNALSYKMQQTSSVLSARADIPQNYLGKKNTSYFS